MIQKYDRQIKNEWNGKYRILFISLHVFDHIIQSETVYNQY